jgi:two-component system sensor histidine kinase TctE
VSVQHGRFSLTRRLLLVLISSLTAVALLLAAGGAWFSHGVAERTGDRVLQASARAIVETLAVENDEITLDLPPAAFGMLESEARDNIYYSIRHGETLLTGYPDFPMAPLAALAPDETHFRYDTYRGARVRVATEVRRLPRVEGWVVVQLAETLDERRALFRRMLIGVAVLEGALVLMAGILVWPAVRWSLRPVIRLRRELERRSVAAAHFTPLRSASVPAELQDLVDAFNALLHRLEQAVTGMRRFTADASHQMRTPLAILQAHIAVLREHGADSEQGRSSLDDIEAATERLRRLLTQLLALARAEETVVGDTRRQMLDLEAVAAETARALAPLALQHDVEITFDSDGPAPVRGDPLLVGQIASNLVENAVFYNRPGGKVTVRVRSGPYGGRLEVEDDGPGIPEAERERVFERFHRLSRDQGRVGSGLGLPIVRTLAEALGGEVRLSAGDRGVGLAAVVAFPPCALPETSAGQGASPLPQEVGAGQLIEGHE